VIIRRAEAADVDFLVDLYANEEVEPFLAARRARDREGVLAEIGRSEAEPADVGVFVIEIDGERAGTMAFEVQNRRSRIAHLGGLALHPDFRGDRHADEAARWLQRHLLLELGFHRLQLEIYGFNERAIRHAERVGFTLEGRRRKAYRRHGGWVDGVMYALIREDLGLPPGVDVLYEYIGRHNLGVREGDWEGLAECFAEDAVLEFDGAPVGPFAGRDAIVAAYEQRPPDDEVRILSAEDGEPVVACYAWAAQPDVPAGTLRLTLGAGRIERLAVTV
jgi:RimJ/RimL family protein N-acetyltransferase